MFNRFFVSRKIYDNTVTAYKYKIAEMEVARQVSEVTNENYLPLKIAYEKCRDENLELKRKIDELYGTSKREEE